MLELVVLHQQQDRLEHGDGQQAIREDRQQDMRQDSGVSLNRADGAGRHEFGEQYRQRSQGEQQ